MIRPPKGAVVVDPFAGKGDLLKWLGPGYIELAYDIEPAARNVFRRDSLAHPPRYAGTYVLADPPELAKHNAENKAMFDHWGVDNLYKCFVKSILKDAPLGGIMIVPLNFLNGVLDGEKKRRREFFRRFKPIRINIFERLLLAETDYIVTAIQFEVRTTFDAAKEPVTLNFYPSNTELHFEVNPREYVFPDESPLDVFGKPPSSKYINLRRHEEDRPLKPSEQLTHLYFEGYDSDAAESCGQDRIGLRWTDAIHVGKPLFTSNSKAQIVVRGHLSRRLQLRIINDFNACIEDWRKKTRSIFLPHYYDTKGRWRRRMSYDIAVCAIRHLIWTYADKH